MSQPGKSEVTVSLDGINGQPTPGQQPPQNSQDTQQPAPGAAGDSDDLHGDSKRETRP